MTSFSLTGKISAPPRRAANIVWDCGGLGNSQLRAATAYLAAYPHRVHKVVAAHQAPLLAGFLPLAAAGRKTCR